MAKSPGRPQLYERRFNFLITKAQDDAMKLLHQRDGISPSEAARRALDAYLKEKGVLNRKRR